jgi:hypothetical protein
MTVFSRENALHTEQTMIPNQGQKHRFFQTVALETIIVMVGTTIGIATLTS